jgi:hypothetical protein
VLPAWVSERFAAQGQGRAMGLLPTLFCIANVSGALSGGLLALLRWAREAPGHARFPTTMATWQRSGRRRCWRS